MRQPSIFSAVLLLASVRALAAGPATRPPVDYVSPNIGSIGQLLSATMPFVQVPYGLARLVPVTTPGIQDRYLADKIYGFSPGAGMLMASTGEVSSEPAAYASGFDHDFETATPKPRFYHGSAAASLLSIMFTMTRDFSRRLHGEKRRLFRRSRENAVKPFP
jgi:hypothetical protein